MNVVFLSLGGNTGNRLANLSAAKQLIRRKCGNILKSSSIYETAPWGSNSANQYLNQVIEITTVLSPAKLLKQLFKIERDLGRFRGTDRNADRTMDIDILFFEDRVIGTKSIQVPHPRLHLRNFILQPMSELAKDLIHPVLNKNIGQLIKNCPDKLAVKKFKDFPKLRQICIEGNIGVGKSTLAAALAKKLNAGLLTESPEQQAILPLFYEDPENFGFLLEYSFLIRRFEQMLGVQQRSGIVVSDFAFAKSLWFAKVNLKASDYKAFARQYQALASKLKSCDLFIYLETRDENLLKNIKRRNRKYELSIQSPYLSRISGSYAAGIKDLQGLQLHLYIDQYQGNTTKLLLDEIFIFIKENFGQQSLKV